MSIVYGNPIMLGGGVSSSFGAFLYFLSLKTDNVFKNFGDTSVIDTHSKLIDNKTIAEDTPGLFNCLKDGDYHLYYVGRGSRTTKGVLDPQEYNVKSITTDPTTGDPVTTTLSHGWFNAGGVRGDAKKDSSSNYKLPPVELDVSLKVGDIVYVEYRTVDVRSSGCLSITPIADEEEPSEE